MAEMFCCKGECAGTLARGRLRFGFEIAEDCYSRNIGRIALAGPSFKFA